jgi:hypothetical protein
MPKKSDVVRHKRLHGQQFNIKILYNSPYYQKLKLRSDFQDFQDFRIKLFKNSINLYVIRDFTAKTGMDAHNDSLEFLNKTLKFLERRYHIMLLKKGYQNIKEVKSHYAEIGNELAHKANKNHDHIQLRGADGKVWLQTDASFNLDELEAIHPETGQHDIDHVVSPLMARLRHDPYFFEKLLEIQLKTQEQLLSVTTIIKQAAESITKFNEATQRQQQPPPSAPDAPQPRADYIG